MYEKDVVKRYIERERMLVEGNLEGNLERERRFIGWWGIK